MHDRCEQLGPPPADLPGGRVLGQLGVLLLERPQLPDEVIVVGIGDDRRVADVVPLVVLEDLVAQRRGPPDHVVGDGVAHSGECTQPA